MHYPSNERKEFSSKKKDDIVETKRKARQNKARISWGRERRQNQKRTRIHIIRQNEKNKKKVVGGIG